MNIHQIVERLYVDYSHYSIIHQIAEKMEWLYIYYGYYPIIFENDEILNDELLGDAIRTLTENGKLHGFYYCQLLENICQNNNIEVISCPIKSISDEYEVCSFILKDKGNGEIVFRLNIPHCC